MAARAHYERALISLSHSLANVKRDNCDAVFLSSRLMFIAFSVMPSDYDNEYGNNTLPRGHSIRFSPLPDSSQSLPSDSFLASLDRVLEWLGLVRGIFSTFVLFEEWIKRGFLYTTLSKDPQSESKFLNGSVNPEDDSYLHRYSEFLTLSPETDPATADFCEKAIVQLRKYMVIMDGKYWPETAFLWALLVSEDFMNAIKRRRPEALVILAFFGGFLGKSELMWWAEGWPVYVARAVKGNLDFRWKRWIQWPLETLGLEQILRGNSPELSSPKNPRV